VAPDFSYKETFSGVSDETSFCATIWTIVDGHMIAKNSVYYQFGDTYGTTTMEDNVHVTSWPTGYSQNDNANNYAQHNPDTVTSAPAHPPSNLISVNYHKSTENVVIIEEVKDKSIKGSSKGSHVGSRLTVNSGQEKNEVEEEDGSDILRGFETVYHPSIAGMQIENSNFQSQAGLFEKLKTTQGEQTLKFHFTGEMESSPSWKRCKKRLRSAEDDGPHVAEKTRSLSSLLTSPTSPTNGDRNESSSDALPIVKVTPAKTHLRKTSSVGARLEIGIFLKKDAPTKPIPEIIIRGLEASACPGSGQKISNNSSFINSNLELEGTVNFRFEMEESSNSSSADMTI